MTDRECIPARDTRRGDLWLGSGRKVAMVWPHAPGRAGHLTVRFDDGSVTACRRDADVAVRRPA